jgi:hypothetical protein
MVDKCEVSVLGRLEWSKKNRRLCAGLVDVDDGSNDDRAFRIKREAADRLERHILERDVELGEVADNLLRQLIGWGE